MEIRLFGAGCWRCRTLEVRAREALAKLGREAKIIKVDDVMAIATTGVLSVPAMAIDGCVVLQGRVPSVRELAGILATAFAATA
jgi:small redox-active disulfide protein 2